MATLTAISRNNGSLGSYRKESLIGFLLTDDLSYILAGALEDEPIILKEGDTLTDLLKHSVTLADITKNSGVLVGVARNSGSLANILKN
jgi:hypothetical protein